MDYFYSIDDDGEWLADYPEYCPKCGARNVIEQKTEVKQDG